jgi:hypothetical protein
MSFHILEDPSNGVTDVFLSHTRLTDIDPAIWQDEEFDWESDSDFELEAIDKEKIFSILHNPVIINKYFDSPEMLYVVAKEKLEISDYYELVHKYITEFCEFVDQDYAIYFKVNS